MAWARDAQSILVSIDSLPSKFANDNTGRAVLQMNIHLVSWEYNFAAVNYVDTRDSFVQAYILVILHLTLMSHSSTSMLTVHQRTSWSFTILVEAVLTMYMHLACSAIARSRTTGSTDGMCADSCYLCNHALSGISLAIE